MFEPKNSFDFSTVLQFYQVALDSIDVFVVKNCLRAQTSAVYYDPTWKIDYIINISDIFGHKLNIKLFAFGNELLQEFLEIDLYGLEINHIKFSFSDGH